MNQNNLSGYSVDELKAKRDELIGFSLPASRISESDRQFGLAISQELQRRRIAAREARS